MAINVSVSDAKARLSGYIEQAAESDEAVVIESHGTPKAVLIPYKAYQQFMLWQEERRRRQALDELQQLARRVAAKNQDLSVAAGEALADRFTREVVEEMIAEGKVQYDVEAE
jgi:prevent-host-death family protein